MFQEFPYTNFHELNLDWIVKIAKDFLDQYTHIQEVIQTGLADLAESRETGLEELNQKTLDGLAELQEKYDTLNGLLQAWYDTHSADIAGQLAQAIIDFNTAAEAKSQALLDSWPADYSELVAECNNLKNTLKTEIYSKEVSTAGEIGKVYPTGSKYYIIGGKTSGITSIALFEFKTGGTYSKIFESSNDVFDFWYTPANDVDYLRIYAGQVASTGSVKCTVIDYSNNYDTIPQIFNNFNVGAYDINSLITSDNLMGFSNVKDFPPNKMFAISSNITENMIGGLPEYGKNGTIVSFVPRMIYSSDKRNSIYLYENLDKNAYIGIADTITIRWQRIDNKDFETIFNSLNLYKRSSTSSGEITKLYPESGKNYDLFLYDLKKCSIAIYEYYTGGYSLLASAESSLTENFYFHYVPSANASYLRVYMTHKGESGETANASLNILDSANILSPMINRTIMPATDYTMSKEFAAVRKFTVIGDSMASGYYKESSNGNQHPRNIPYSWPQIMAKMYGQTAENASKSGATTADWWTDTDGYCKAHVNTYDRSQVYIVGIGTNDYKDIPDDQITAEQIGSFSDVDQSDYTLNADSFWGNYCKILQYVHDVAPYAKIICLTIPAPRPNTAWKQQAIREICAESFFSEYVVLCDLEKYYSDLSNSKAMQSEMWQSHFTPVGYANSAEFLMYALSKTIQENRTMFINLPLIPYDLPVTQEGVNAILKAYNNDAVDITSGSATYIAVTGKCVTVGDFVYADLLIYWINSITSGLNSVFVGLPEPDNSKIQIPEYGEGEEALQTYISYATAWRINGAHTAGDVTRVFMKYKKASE